MTTFENRSERVRKIAFLVCLWISLDISSAIAQNLPANLDFETKDPTSGQIAEPWFVGQNQPSYQISLDSNGAYHGKYWARIRSIHAPNDKEFANLMQSFDAKPYLGRFIKYRAAARHIGNIRGDARLWMRVDRAEKRKCFFSSKTDRPIKSTNWEEYQMIGYVAPDAVDIYIGCSLMGDGAIGFDAVSIDTLSKTNDELIHNFQMPEYLTFVVSGGATEDVRTDDIDKITPSQDNALVTLNNGRQIHATGNYEELARYFEKSK